MIRTSGIMISVVILFFVCGYFVGCNVSSYELRLIQEPQPGVDMRKLVIVYSYTKGFYQVEFEDGGIFQGLAEEGFFEGINIKIERYYMDCKVENNTPLKRYQFASRVREELSEDPPDLMIIGDDCAFEWMALNVSSTNVQFPMLFIGVGTDINELNNEYQFFNTLQKPGKNISGIIENYYIFESIRLMTYVSSLRNTKVVFLSDNSSISPLGYESEIAIIRERCKENLNITFEVIYVKTIQDIYRAIETVIKPDKSNIKAIGSMIWNSKDENDPNIKYGTMEVVEYILELVKYDFITIAVNLGITQKGYLGGIVVDTVHMGELIGEYAGRILNSDVIVGNLPIVNSPPTCSWYKTRFTDLNIHIENDNLFSYATFVYQDPPKKEHEETVIITNKFDLNLLFYLFFLILLPTPLPFCFLFYLGVVCCMCCCVCFISCITICVLGYTSKLVRFKSKFDNVDVDELLVELMSRDEDQYLGFRSKTRASGNLNVNIPHRLSANTIQERLVIRKEMFKIPYSQIKLKNVVGKGGQSVVFLAKWKNKKVAYKSFNSVMITNIEDFQIESSILACLNHPNILKLYGIVLEPYSSIGTSLKAKKQKSSKGLSSSKFEEINTRMRCGIVEEYCENKTLSDFIQDRMFLETPPKMIEKIEFLKQIADGMDYLHEKNIIHRDLKLKNILLDRNYVIKIIDFGLSRVSKNFHGASSSVKTKKIGSSGYIAPEVYDGKYNLSIDVYSFGIILWCFLTNKSNVEQKLWSEESKKNVHVEYSDIKAAMDPNYRPYYNLEEIQKENNRYSKEFKDIESWKWYENLMKSCWSHDSENRPTFEKIREIMKINTKKKKKKKKTEDDDGEGEVRKEAIFLDVQGGDNDDVEDDDVKIGKGGETSYHKFE